METVEKLQSMNDHLEKKLDKTEQLNSELLEALKEIDKVSDSPMIRGIAKRAISKATKGISEEDYNRVTGVTK